MPAKAQIAALLPAMRQCAEDVRAAFSRNRRALAPIGAVLAAADEMVNGQGVPAASGLGELIVELGSTGAPKKRSLVLAINALGQFAYALEELSRGDPDGRVEQHLSDARDFAAMSVARAEAPPTVADVAARIAKLSPGDLAELQTLVDLVVEHRMKKLVPKLFERLDLDDSTGVPSGAARSLQVLFRAPAEALAFAQMCVALLAHAEPGPRRWAAYVLRNRLRPEHVPPLCALLSDGEPHVRKEAATTLRAAATWHPQTKEAIHEAAVAAAAAHPEDAALAELVRQTEG